MIKTKVVSLVADVPVKILDANAARVGWKVRNIGGTNTPDVRVKSGSAPGISDVNQQQTITFSGTPTSGTFKLRYNGNSTTALAHNVSAGSVQTALRLLAGLSAVTVSGTVAGGLVVTMAGVGFPPEKLSVVENSLLIAGSADVQSLDFDSVPTAGSFRLLVKRLNSAGSIVSVKSGPIPYTATSSTLQTQLRQLLNDNSLAVTGNFTSGFQITFSSYRAKLKLLEIVENSLSIDEEPEDQLITFSAEPEAGSFKLSYMGVETDAIAFDALDSDVEDALREIEGLEQVTVSGDFADGFGVLFVGVFGDEQGHVPNLEVVDNELALDDAAEEVQLVEFDNVPDAGSFKLKYGLLSTALILFSDNAAAVEAALQALAGLEDVTVTGDFTSGFEITFVGFFEPVALLEVTNNTLEIASVPEVQTVSFDLVPDAGSFRLAHGMNQTDLIPHNANAAAVQDALRELAGLGAVTVTGNFTDDFEVTFVGVNGDTAQLTNANNTLTNMATPVVITHATTTPGVASDATAVDVTETTEGQTATLIDAEVEEVTPNEGQDGVTVTASIDTQGTLDEDISGSMSINVVGSSDNDGELIAEGDTLDRSSDGWVQDIYAVADSDTPDIEVTEVF